MVMIWTIAALPELQGLTTAERRTLLQGTFSIRSRIIEVVRRGLVALLAALCTGAVMHHLTRQADIAALVAVAVLVVGFLALHLWRIGSIRRQLQWEIVERHRGQRLPLCLKCGYDLTQNDQSTRQCPECGAGVWVKERPASEA